MTARWKEQIEQAVRESGPRGLTARQAAERLRQLDPGGSGPSVVHVRAVLRELAAQGKLLADTGPTSGPGSPELIYYHTDVVAEHLLRSPAETDDDIESGMPVAEGLETVLRSFHRVVEGDPVLRAAQRNALRLAGENPRDVIERIADWAQQRAAELERDMLRAPGGRERSAILDRLTRLARFCDLVFRRTLNIPETVFSINAYPLRGLAAGRSPRGDEIVCCDRNRLRELLDIYVCGDRLACIETVDPSVRVEAVCSTDASIQDVPDWDTLPLQGGLFVEDAETHAIIVSAAALRPVQSATASGAQDFYDFDVDPRYLVAYERAQALREARFLPADLRRALGEDRWHRIRWAAMQIRQYEHDSRVLQGKVAWKNSELRRVTLHDYRLSRPRVIFHDGRLFPLEHRLDNYEAPDYYGEIVRRQVGELINLAGRPEVEHCTISICGIVKKPELPVFSPVIVWILHRLEPDVVTEDDVLRSGDYPDSLLLHPILTAIAREARPEPGAFAVTFMVVRRFATLGVPDGAVLWDGRTPMTELEWREWFYDVYLQRGNRARRLDDVEYEPFIRACGRLAVAAFFLHPVDGRLPHRYMMPRYEVLVGSPDSSRFEIPPGTWKGALRLVLQSLTPPDSLDLDTDRNHSEGRLPLIVPSVLSRAHSAARLTGDAFRRAFMALVWEELQNRRRSRKHRSR
jgi:hypothetical protein